MGRIGRSDPAHGYGIPRNNNQHERLTAMRRIERTAGGIAIASMLTMPVFAQESADVHPLLTARFFADVGVYFPKREFTIRVNGSLDDINLPIDFDEQLNLTKNDTTVAFDFGWRFSDRWSVLTQYFESHDGTSVALQQDLEWGDITFGAGSGVGAGQDFRVVRVFFGRTFDSNERHDFGIGAGFHWMEISAYIEGNAIINGVPSGIRRESVAAEAPLPNVGVWYDFSISPRWAIRGRIDWISASVDEYSGHLTNISLGVNYRMLERFGLGLNYNFLELDVDVTKSNWRGQVVTRFSGLYAFLSFYW